MAEQVYDAVVVGAGVEGSATAFQLSRRGVRVLLLEQFSLPHSRGSSHGQTRITRKAYPEHFYTEMMDYCTQQWEEIQQASGEVIYRKIGYLAIGDTKKDFIKTNVSSLEKIGATYTLLTPDKFRTQYPNLTYGEGVGAVYDPDGGILMAEKALKAYQGLFVKQGGHLRDGEPVIKIIPGAIINITTTKHTYQTKSVVLCCGPWTSKLLQPLNLSLPLQPVRISVCYWPEKVPGTYSPDKFKPFMEINEAVGSDIYGMPCEEYPGNVKLCLHNGPAIDPDRRDSVESEWAVKLARDYVRDHFPGLVPEPSVVESCIYTFTPDKHFILDRHPVWKNIVIGAGFSGHGFKLSPAVGKILGDLALHLPVDYDLSPFRLDRFPQSITQKSNL